MPSVGINLRHDATSRTSAFWSASGSTRHALTPAQTATCILYMHAVQKSRAVKTDVQTTFYRAHVLRPFILLTTARNPFRRCGRCFAFGPCTFGCNPTCRSVDQRVSASSTNNVPQSRHPSVAAMVSSPRFAHHKRHWMCSINSEMSTFLEPATLHSLALPSTEVAGVCRLHAKCPRSVQAPNEALNLDTRADGRVLTAPQLLAEMLSCS